MKKSKILFLTVLGFFTLFTLFSCNKDAEKENLSTELQNRSSSFQIVLGSRASIHHGMLFFPSFESFKSLYDEMKSKNGNASMVSDAYAHLGIDPNVEGFVTESPIHKELELRLGHTSLRHSEELRLLAHLERGQDGITFDSPICFIDENFQTILNSNGEVKIGKKYFRFYDDNALLVVGNDDYATFNGIRNHKHEDIESSYNVRVIDGVKDAKFLFDMAGTNRSEKDIVDLKIGFGQEMNGTIQLVNKSFVDFTNHSMISYRWTFQDGTTQTGLNPSKYGVPGEKVRLTLVKDGADHSYTDVTVRGGPTTICDHEIRGRFIRGCEVEVTILNLDWNGTFGPNNVGRVEWRLPNGTRRPGQNIQFGNKVVINADNDGEPFVITVALFDKNGQLICTQTHTVFCKCGETWTNKDQEEFPQPISGKRWRIDVEIWVKNNIFVESCGSKTISKRKDALGFVKKPVEILYASFKGIIQCGELPGCPDEVIPFSEETEVNGGHLQRDIDPDCKDPSALRGQMRCESSHWFKVGGVTVRFTKNGGILFLN